MQMEVARLTTDDELPERPALAPGVELVGKMRDSAFQDAQWLVQRCGTFIQMSEPLYRVAEYSNGARARGEIAALVSKSIDLSVTDTQVGQMLAQNLVPLGIVEAGDEPEAGEPAAEWVPPSPLKVNLRLKVLGPRFIDPVARILQFLYIPVLLVPLLACVGAVQWWLYGVHGFSATIHDIVYVPGALLGAVGLYLASGVFHEFGHASALRYGGGNARCMGIGIYLIYPILYTDTTDSYRLGRWGRVRTDLGGFYFHLLFALAIMAAYFESRQEWLLLVVLLIDLDITRQLFPFVRFDGYWAITDLLGVPDILSHMKATLTRGVERRGRPSGIAPLKPWAGAVFALYTLVTVPLLGALMVLTLMRGPLFLASVLKALVIDVDQLQRAVVHAQVLTAVAAGAGFVLLAIQAVGIVFLLFMIVGQPVQALWRWSGSRTVHRVVTISLSSAAIGLLMYYWVSTLAQLR